MKQQIKIQKSVITENHLLLQAESDVPVSKLEAVGRILVDSEHFAFIYLTEQNGEYTYIVLSEPFWPDLKKALEANIPVFVESQGDRLELMSFHEELQFLIENIKGNSNYGEEMVTKVESAF